MEGGREVRGEREGGGGKRLFDTVQRQICRKHSPCSTKHVMHSLFTHVEMWRHM